MKENSKEGLKVILSHKKTLYYEEYRILTELLPDASLRALRPGVTRLRDCLWPLSLPTPWLSSCFQPPLSDGWPL